MRCPFATAVRPAAIAGQRTRAGWIHQALAGAGALWRGWLQRSIADQGDASRANLQTLAARLKSTGALLPVPAAADPCERLDGSGQGSVQTARGPLEYRLTLAQGRWIDCQIKSPTDRTFAPGGPATQLLARLHQANDPLRAVRWVIAALDPCVAVEVRAAASQARSCSFRPADAALSSPSARGLGKIRRCAPCAAAARAR